MPLHQLPQANEIKNAEEIISQIQNERITLNNPKKFALNSIADRLRIEL